MDFVNETGLPAGWCVGFQKDGRELLVVVVKATYTLKKGGDPELATEQVPLVKADEFTCEPGLSATRYESDYAHHKPVCDVVVNGAAHAPRGRRVSKVTVGLRVGPIQKRFEVFGDRVWRKHLFRTRPGAPRAFAHIPISYDRAYGGADRSKKDPDTVLMYPENPVGMGYYPLSRGASLVGRPIPNTEEPGKAATQPKGKYAPMSLGPIGRNFKVRVQFAGTYDQKWQEERLPYFPDDFDYRYFQCAPPDQQMPYPAGGEEVVLENLTPEGMLRFRLPARELPILVIPHLGEVQQLAPVIDTIVIEPDESRLMLTWRTSLPMKKSCFDVRQVVVDRNAEKHLGEARRAAKTHHANLADMVSAKKAGRGR